MGGYREFLGNAVGGACALVTGLAMSPFIMAKTAIEGGEGSFTERYHEQVNKVAAPVMEKVFEVGQTHAVTIVGIVAGKAAESLGGAGGKDRHG